MRVLNAARATILFVGFLGLAVQASMVAIPGGVANPADGATGFGSVGYDYWISSYEVTAAEYTVFLNAVAKTDPHGLYNTSMPNTGNAECGIVRSGVSGSYTYSVAAAMANRPVNFTGFYDAARYANWLTTGNTELGVYTLSGTLVTAVMNHVAAGAIYYGAYFLPTEDEWYKAAYYNPISSNYYLYPTSSNSAPVNSPVGSSSNEATFQAGTIPNYTIGAPYYRTEVGQHVNTTSPYGLFDMAGNVWEWTEGIANVSNRVVRGGSYNDGVGSSLTNLQSTTRNGINPQTSENAVIGFRLSMTVPEPSACGLLALAGLVTGLVRRRRTTC